MKIYSVYDKEFEEYGRIINDVNCDELTQVLLKLEMPNKGTLYRPSIPELEECNIFNEIKDHVYGGMPIQLGACWGYNTKLNCLEYHLDSELNLGTDEFVLLLAKRQEIKDMMLNTNTVKAFKVPANILVEVYATSLHYAPCHLDDSKGFRTLVVLPKGTNTEAPCIAEPKGDDLYMTARNKWLFAHPESPETENGAKIGLIGNNIDIKIN